MSQEKKPSKKYYDHVSVAKRTPQSAYFVQNHDKNRMFEEIFKSLNEKKLLVMVKSKRAADGLMEYLHVKNILALCAHGNHRDSQIQEAQNSFNTQKPAIFITTDRILEKLTLEGIEVVLNFDLPLEASDYFLRLRIVDEIGESISFIDPEDEGVLARVEHMMKDEMPEVELEGFEHSKNEPTQTKDVVKKPRHKKVQQRAKRKAEIKSQWVPTK
jgi:ATP-dependent RNA helicase RhlE